MNSPREGAQSAKPYIMTTMLNPTIVWDTARLAIAIKMTDEERTVIAKRATGILRNDMPEILATFSSYEAARSRFAQSTIVQQLIKENLLNVNEVKQGNKSRRIVEKEWQAIDSVTQKYRTQTGYRMSCLSLLLPKADGSEQALCALDELHILNQAQQTVFQGLLLEDLIHWNTGYDLAITDYNAGPLTAGYVEKLSIRSASVTEMLKTLKTPIEGRPLSHYIDDARLKNPVLNGADMSNPIITATTEFSLLKNCFKHMNEKLSGQIANKTDDAKFDSSDWSLSLLRSGNGASGAQTSHHGSLDTKIR